MDFDQLLKEIRFYAVRSRGPGGQNVNKVASAALLCFSFRESRYLSPEEKSLIAQKLSSQTNKEGELLIRSDEYRDLPRNKDRCLEKLRLLLAAAFFVPKIRRKTRATRASKIRKKDSKQRQAQAKKLRQKVQD